MENNKILIAFKKIIESEKVIESLKQELALRPDYNLQTNFKIIDEKGKGLVGFTYFCNFLKLMKISKNKLKMAPSLFELFDADSDEMISFSEFKSVLKPRDQRYQVFGKVKKSGSGKTSARGNKNKNLSLSDFVKVRRIKVLC